MLSISRFKKALSVFLTLCLLLFGAFALDTTASAAGPGYSDLFRIYTLSGLDKDTKVSAIALMYGDPNNNPASNYALVMKMRSGSYDMLMDVVSGDTFNTIQQNCLTSSQMDVSSFNETMLANGAPDSMLILSEKPNIVKEIEKAVASGQTTLTAQDSLVIFPDALKLAAQKGGSSFRIQFDSMRGNTVAVRLTVNPSAATKGIVTDAFVDESYLNSLVEKYESRYNNQVAVIDLYQEGSFGTTVNISARLDLKDLNTETLRFYSFNQVTNKYSEIENVPYSVSKGYLNFSTSIGGTIVITDRPLQRKSSGSES